MLLVSCASNTGYYDDAFISANIRLSDVFALVTKVSEFEKSQLKVSEISSVKGKKECRIGIMDGCYVRVVLSSTHPYDMNSGMGISYQFVYNDGRWMHLRGEDKHWIN